MSKRLLFILISFFLVLGVAGAKIRNTHPSAHRFPGPPPLQISKTGSRT